MSFSIRNLEQYLDEHSDMFPDRATILAQAQAALEPGSKILSGGLADGLLGAEQAQQFLFNVCSDPMHMQMWQEDLSSTTEPLSDVFEGSTPDLGDLFTLALFAIVLVRGYPPDGPDPSLN